MAFILNGNQLTKVEDEVTSTSYTGGTNFVNGSTAVTEYAYNENGNLTKDLNKNITNVSYNCLNLPQAITFTDGSMISYLYSADGKKLRTVHVINGGTTQTDYCGNVLYENGVQKRMLTEEGYIDLTTSTPAYYYYLKDHQGNNRVVVNSSGVVQETNHYYPFGGLFATNSSVQPYKYNDKEFDSKGGLNWYDFGARHYDATLGRWHVVDPMAEKYYSISSYDFCGGNPINRIDLDGMDWYQNNETKYYEWYIGNEDRNGYTYIGERGSVLGEFESIIDHLLINVYEVGSMYRTGFSFDITPYDKGALIGSKERDWDFFSEFVNGTGPEISIFLSNHPYTEDMKTAEGVLKGQQRIKNRDTTIPGQITAVEGSWGLWDVVTTLSMAKQFVGSYRYDAFTSSDGMYLNNVVSDSKSRSSLFYHLYPSRLNRYRYQQKIMGNTYQFYIWKSKK